MQWHFGPFRLDEVYAWFREGLDTVDLQEARTLLEQLA